MSIKDQDYTSGLQSQPGSIRVFVDEFKASNMTKRELFAAIGMAGLYAGYYAHPDGVRGVREAAHIRGLGDTAMMALAAVQGADALLAELAK